MESDRARTKRFSPVDDSYIFDALCYLGTKRKRPKRIMRRSTDIESVAVKHELLSHFPGLNEEMK